MLQVVCVLKSGGDYDWEYVSRLGEGVERHLSIPHSFTCYTDIPFYLPEEFDGEGFIIPLEKDLEGCWSKLEIFRTVGEVLYLDLDTIITGNIDYMVKHARLMYASALNKDMFFMLRAFKKGEEWASGLMYWQGDFSWLNYIPSADLEAYGKWEQRFIKHRLYDAQIDIRSIGGEEIKSYKHHCREGVPEDTKIICYHGKPRPRETELWNQLQTQ